MSDKWEAFVPCCSDRHVLPINDSHEHWPYIQCICRPLVLDEHVEGRTVVHYAFDAREHFEGQTCCPEEVH